MTNGIVKNHISPPKDSDVVAESISVRFPINSSIFNKSKKYDCDKCPAKFSERVQLLRHERFHGVNLKLKCYLCNYAVNFRINMSKHLQNHHKITDLESGMAECRKNSKLCRKGQRRKSLAGENEILFKFDKF